MQFSFYVEDDLVEYYEEFKSITNFNRQIRDEIGKQFLTADSVLGFFTWQFGIKALHCKWKGHDVMLRITVNRFTIPYTYKHKIYVDGEFQTIVVSKVRRLERKIEKQSMFGNSATPH